MKEVLIVSIGSFFGGGMRYWISKMVQSCTVIAFPFGTMAVNVAGCLIIGFLSGLNWREGGWMSPSAKLLLTTGFCGGFTTFSTFMNEGGRTDERRELPLYDALSLRKSGAGTYRRSRRTLSGEDYRIKDFGEQKEEEPGLSHKILKIVFHQMKKR